MIVWGTYQVAKCWAKSRVGRELQRLVRELVNGGVLLLGRTKGSEPRIGNFELRVDGTVAEPTHVSHQNDAATVKAFSDPINCKRVGRIYSDVLRVATGDEVAQRAPP